MRGIEKLTLLCCLLLLAMVGWGGLQVRDLADAWEDNTKARRTSMQTLTTADVKNKSGRLATIITQRNPEETDAAFAARHLAACVAWENTTG